MSDHDRTATKMADRDFDPDLPVWRTTPPYWDQRMGKRLTGDWSFYFIQVNRDGGETYHHYKARGIEVLRVGRLGDIEQTATWNWLHGEPAMPPGKGWTLHRECSGYCLWRREALVKAAT